MYTQSDNALKSQQKSLKNSHHSRSSPMHLEGHGVDKNQSHGKSESHGLFIEGDIKIIKILDLASEGMCCKFNENGDKLAVGLANGDIKIFNRETASLLYHLADDDTHADRLPVTTIHFLPPDLSTRGELLIATYAGGMVKFWHVATSSVLQTIHEPRQILAGSLSPEGTTFVTGGTTEQMNVYDVETSKKIHCCETSINRLVMDGHRFRVFALKHHHRETNMFLSGGWDDTVQVWDTRANHAVRRIFGPHICGDGIDIDKKYNHILTSSWRKDEVLQVWDFATGAFVKTIPADFSADSALYCGQWLGKDHIVCGGSSANMLRIVDKSSLVTSGIISNLPSAVFSVDHNRDQLTKSGNNGITTISATVGNRLYFILNSDKKE